MHEVTNVTGTVIPLLLDDIDTDRIIPARYLRCVTFDGIGEHAFEDDRKQDPNHPFNQERFRSGSVLVSGRNFGCGSSREHAPQSLYRWGVKAVIAETFAEIFFGNCTALGIPAVCCERDAVVAICAAVDADPSIEVAVDLESLTVSCGETSYACTMDENARTALLTGNWDFLAQLLINQDGISHTASQLPYLSGFAATTK
jgi:3-isopropylmalate/(R)-2-methylmalate dehydratase small subunit